MDHGEPRVNRRRFLATASATAIAMHWHDSMAVGAAGGRAWRPRSRGVEHRLRGLRLETAAPLDDMRNYYEKILELPILRQTSDELTIEGGATTITFVKPRKEGTWPWYHVAFNIPENKLFLAREWLLERTTLKPRRPDQSRHPDYPDVADFQHWNAHAVFFWDPAGNLLEYIARHTLDNAASGPFTPRDVLCASEIGLMADDVGKLAEQVSAGVNLPDYIGSNDHFRPLGDHHGLVIIFKTGRKWQAADGTSRPAMAYPADVVLAGEKSAEYTAPEYPYALRAEPVTDDPRPRPDAAGSD